MAHDIKEDEKERYVWMLHKLLHWSHALLFFLWLLVLIFSARFFFLSIDQFFSFFSWINLTSKLPVSRFFSVLNKKPMQMRWLQLKICAKHFIKYSNYNRVMRPQQQEHHHQLQQQQQPQQKQEEKEEGVEVQEPQQMKNLLFRFLVIV